MKKAKYPEVLKSFMLEMFDFDGLLKVGLFKENMRHDYQAQADKICKFFGYETVFEYRAKSINAHISFVGERPKGYENFVTEFKSIYES